MMGDDGIGISYFILKPLSQTFRGQMGLKTCDVLDDIRCIGPISLLNRHLTKGILLSE